MVTKDSAAPQASPSGEAQPGTYEAPLLNPRSPIEVTPGVGSTTGNPGASDHQPPGVTDFELLV